ncbi:MAG: phosphoglycerate kinase [Candidatus Moraniibacteriota bacterium]|nr:MAG: phosphoglycerate kinase [Candidatus Moranbacteria bacterium]
MNLRSVRDANVAGKKVLVRVDCNVELNESQDVKEKYKVAAAHHTVEYLLSQGARVALATHLGRPNGKPDDSFSVRHIVDDVERILARTVRFSESCIGDGVESSLEDLAEGEILLLENVRFFPGDEANDPAFAQALAAPFDVFVNDAFSVCHRDQASVTGVTKFLPSFAGLHLLDEVKHLTDARERPIRPAVAIIGGAKIETKLPIIRMFEEKYDCVLVAGKVACEAQDEHISFSDKVLLPEDYAPERQDIGSKTLLRFRDEILKAKTVVWNGPLGKFENPEYAAGTHMTLASIIESGAFSIVGGGETIIALEEAGLFQKISFVSTGGGAMLEFLSGDPLPGLLTLEDETR